MKSVVCNYEQICFLEKTTKLCRNFCGCVFKNGTARTAKVLNDAC